MKKYTFYTDCVSIPRDQVDDLTDLTDEDEEITYDDFIKVVPESELRTIFPKYDWTEEGEELPEDAFELRMEDDWHLYYGKGDFRGETCYFFIHSGIEHLFLPEDSPVRGGHRMEKAYLSRF